ncbi:hypothetical protein PUN28_011572 [Cardiocondyla obscurior]|uniref:Uncharacterized protein n=1 Tax=Cardiocondyla obscurior TaxID=286306 RepID=A0AAW2FJ60_9HYME
MIICKYIYTSYYKIYIHLILLFWLRMYTIRVCERNTILEINLIKLSSSGTLLLQYFFIYRKIYFNTCALNLFYFILLLRILNSPEPKTIYDILCVVCKYTLDTFPQRISMYLEKTIASEYLRLHYLYCFLPNSAFGHVKSRWRFIDTRFVLFFPFTHFKKQLTKMQSFSSLNTYYVYQSRYMD